MKNTSPGLPWSESVISLTKMSHKMKRSGYPASWRRETFLSAISKYSTRRKDDQEGRRPLYRDGIKEERSLNKAKASTGYKVDCMECSTEDLVATYHGETGRNRYSRGLEHVADLGTRKSTSPLWKHCEI